MSELITIQLSDHTAKRLKEFSEAHNISQEDLIIEGLERIFSKRSDKNIAYLTDEQFSAVMDILERPRSREEEEGLKRLENAIYPWES